MFRITKNGMFFTHKCIQCGIVTTYNELGVSSCETCKATQRLRADEGKTSAPVRFIMDMTDCWRRMYYEKDTNIP